MATMQNLATRLARLSVSRAPVCYTPLITARSLHTSGVASDKPSPPPVVHPDQGVSTLFSQFTSKKVTEEGPKATAPSKLKPGALYIPGKPVPLEEFQASTSNFKTSTRKLRFLADQIVGLDVNEAIKQMEFSAKKSSKKVLGTLALARNNARLQKEMDPAKLFVARAWVGKGQYLKRIRIHGRGRFGTMHHPRAHMKFVLSERQPEPEGLGRGRRRDIRGWQLTKKVWTSLQDKPIYNAKPYYNW